MSESLIPDKCCKCTGNGPDGRALYCGEPTTNWCLHNEDVCSYCEKHRYVCGVQLVKVLCSRCQKPMLLGVKLVEDCGADCFVCDDCPMTEPMPCETCGKMDCDGSCCDCEYCIRRRD